MKKIVSVISMTDFNRELAVIDEDNLKILETKHINNEELISTIFSLIEQYNIEKLHIFGQEEYLKGIQRQIKNEELTKYNKNILNIEIN